MNKSDLIRKLSKRENLKLKEAEDIVNLVFKQFIEMLSKGRRVKVRGFGTFIVRKYGTYTVGHPRNGKLIEIAPRKLPFFKVGRDLKEKVNYKK